MHKDYSAAIYVKPAMLIRASIDGPLFYEFIFNLSFDPRLVCPSGFMLSPWGSEVSISCHMGKFGVILIRCFRSMMTTTPLGRCSLGHMHKDSSTVIDEVKPAPVG